MVIGFIFVMVTSQHPSQEISEIWFVVCKSFEFSGKYLCMPSTWWVEDHKIKLPSYVLIYILWNSKMNKKIECVLVVAKTLLRTLRVSVILLSFILHITKKYIGELIWSFTLLWFESSSFKVGNIILLLYIYLTQYRLLPKAFYCF